MESVLLGIEALELLRQEGFPVLESVLSTSLEEALRAAKAIGFPVVLKVSSRSVVHKTEVGGVVTGVVSEEGLRKAYEEVLSRLSETAGSEGLQGVIVQKTGSGLEFSVGVYRDRLFGHVIMVGHGGIHVEALADVSFRLLPITRRDAAEMLEELFISRVFRSQRGQPPNPRALEDLLMLTSAFVERHKEVVELDLNPVFVSSEAQIADARIAFSA